MGELNTAANQPKKARRGLAGLWPSGIKRRWLLNNVSIALAAVFVLVILSAAAITGYYYDSVRASLLSRTSSAKYLNRYMSSTYDEFYYYSNQLVQEFADRDKMEMQIIDVYGRVMFSSTGLSAGFVPGTTDIARCIDTQETAVFTGFDELTGERVMSATAPVVYRNGRIIGVVRYVTSLKLLDKQLGYVYLGLVGGGALLMALVIITNRFFLRSIVNPVLRINELAQIIASGKYGARLDVAFNDEIGELCTTLNNMSSELARMDKLKNDFISSVSHELRTPLTAIGGWAETVANDLGDPVVATAGLAIIQNETRRLSQMVEELLDFSRLENGRLKLQPERFDLRGELYDAVFTYTELLKQEGMEVNY
ncbi:MAG: HAMP domain-containing histidine kinase, partial [Clostridia bacterium]|nr:HAMP domain-containing histidine kinase [Clostridia bacterium]